jgi:hypothetical protein
MPELIPIDHPCVWQGKELLSRKDWLHGVDTDRLDEIAPILADIQASLNND